MEVHPVLLSGVVVASTALVVGFTRPSSITRTAVAPVLILCSFQCIITSIDYMVRSPWASSLGGYTLTFLLHYFDIALLRGWSFETNGPSIDPVTGQRISIDTNKNKKDSTLERLKFGIAATCSFRHIGTPHQVKNVPLFRKNDPGYIPSRARFLLRTGLIFAASYMIVDLITFQVDTEVNLKFFALRNIPLFTRLHMISGGGVVVRIFGTIASGLTVTCVQRASYSLVAFLSVLLGISEPREWPPYYGSLSQAFSLRRVWAVFWHQTNAAKFASMSSFMIQRVLGISRGTQLSRYARLVAVFAISALMHVLVDVAAGISMSNSGALQFFLAQAFGIFVEDLFVGIYCSLLGHGRPRPYYYYLLEKGFGFLWVGAFMVWTSPAYVYPLMYRVNTGKEDSVIPFSIMKLLLPVS